jgi:hypothetical protein
MQLLRRTATNCGTASTSISRRFLRHLRPWWTSIVASRRRSALRSTPWRGQLDRLWRIEIGPRDDKAEVTIMPQLGFRENRSFDRVSIAEARNEVGVRALHAQLVNDGLLRRSPNQARRRGRSADLREGGRRKASSSSDLPPAAATPDRGDPGYPPAAADIAKGCRRLQEPGLPSPAAYSRWDADQPSRSQTGRQDFLASRIDFGANARSAPARSDCSN